MGSADICSSGGAGLVRLEGALEEGGKGCVRAPRAQQLSRAKFATRVENYFPLLWMVHILSSAFIGLFSFQNRAVK